MPSARAGLLLLFTGLPASCALEASQDRRHGRQQGGLLSLEKRYVAHGTSKDGISQRVHRELYSTTDPVNEGKEEFQHASRTAEELPEMMYRGLTGVSADFLPKWRFQLSTFLVGFLTLLISSVWFVVYFTYVYSNDRSDMEDMERWTDLLAAVRARQDEGTDVFRPDLVIVTNHPTFQFSDDDEEVKYDVLDRILKSGSANLFTELEHLKDDAYSRYVDLSDPSQVSLQNLKSSAAQSVSRASAPLMNVAKAFGSSGDGEAPEQKVTRKKVRKAILKDLYRVVQGQFGVDATVFKSIDDDELFVCLTLKNRKSIKYYLSRDRIMLPLNRELLTLIPDQDGETIKLNWVEPACSPPLMPFDPVVVHNLFEGTYAAKGVVLGEGATEESKVFKDYANSGKESCILSVDCVRILHDELNHCIDIGACVEHGLVCVWFPVHNPYSIQELQAVWASWRYCIDPTFVQPVPFLKEYFGARMAFLFAWNGVVCKSLVPLILLAMVWLLTVTVAQWAEFWEINERQVIGFSMVLCIWSKITFNMWTREQNFFQELWGMQGSSDEGLTRPQFRGTDMPSPLNERLQERQEPEHVSKARRAIGALITSMFCLLVFFFVMATLLLFQHRPARIMPWVLTFMIKIFQCIFQFVVKGLTDFENHKFQEDYFNSYLWKLFLFEFVNNYSAFFFLTIKNSWMEEGTNGLEEPQKQVSMTLMLLALCSIMQVPFELVKVQFKLWYEDYAYKKKFEKDPPERSFVEEQAKMITIDEPYEVQNMMTLVIALGYILLFGGVAPRVVLYSFAVFVVQLRAFAVLLTTSAQRPFPQRAQGIGNWGVVVVFLMNCGVIYSGFLFVAFGKTFKKSDIMAKMTGFVIFLVGMYVSWGAIDLFFPGASPEATLLAKRRNYIMKMIMKLTSRNDLKGVKEQSMAEIDKSSAEVIEREEWDLIPGRARNDSVASSKKMLRDSFKMHTPRLSPRQSHRYSAPAKVESTGSDAGDEPEEKGGDPRSVRSGVL